MLRNLCCVLMLLLSSLLQASQNNALPAHLRVALSNDSYPYMFVDEYGNPAGLVVDFWQQVAKQQQIELEFVAVDWPESLQLLAERKVDFHGGLGVTPARARQFLLGQGYLELTSNVFVHRDLSRVTSLADLRPLVVGTVADATHSEILRRLLPGITLKTYPHASALYQAALAGEIQAFTGLDRLTPRYPEFEQLELLFPMYKKVPLQQIQLTFAAAKTNPNLHQALQQAASAVPSGFIDQIERKWLSVATDADSLLIGVSVGNQPFMHVSQSGEVQGFFVDMWRLWSKKTGIKVAFMPAQSDDLLAYLHKSRIDVQMAQMQHPEKMAGLQLAYHLYNLSSSFYFPNSQLIHQLSELAGKKVGIMHTSAYAAELRRNYPDLRWQEYRTLEALIDAAQRKQIAGFFAADLMISKRLSEMNSDSAFSALAEPRFDTAIYSLIRPGNEQLYQQIQQGFAQISLDELIALEQRWLDPAMPAYYRKFREQVPLTVDELDLATQELSVGVMANWPPIEFIASNGEFQGMTADILALLNQRLGARLQAKPYQDWSALMADFEQGKLAAVANMSDLPERHQFAEFSDDYWTLQWVLLGQAQQESVQAVAAMAPKRIAMMQDYQYLHEFVKNYPQHELVPVPSIEQGVDLMVRGDVDFVLDNIVAVGVVLTDPSLINLRVQIPTDLPAEASYFAIHKNYAPLRVLLNKGIKTISDQDRKTIQDKWLNLHIQQGLDRSHLIELILQVVAVAAAVVLVFWVWNYSLRREVNLRRQMEEKMRFMAGHDELTKLANRSLFMERLQSAIHQHARHNELLAVLFMDLDGFKQINDQYGHDVGDELLVQLAQVLKYCVRKTDTVARFGGDEFVLLLTGLVDRDDAAIVAEKILQCLEDSMVLSVCQIRASASIGIAVYPQDGTEAAPLLKVADQLMYQVKQSGKNQYRFSSRKP
ncbi:transporter substrate-binding domain-containing protein [Rheinheimera marina]|uniref:Transporter substrate-binding domain-containing protein n=1 Tax=Rheinheimera marina TaxID=1774958 RepID=A0ABV9JKG7_9GAMM